MSRAHLRMAPSWQAAFAELGVVPDRPDTGLVFAAGTVGDEWPAVLTELTLAFRLSRLAAQADAPVVYIVHSADLLGQRGVGDAMVACGLLSGTRTLALEGRRPGTPCNLLAVEEDTSPHTVATWAVRLLEPGGPTGEVVRIGSLHIGKALP